jgi:hypothetical protein
MEHKYTNDFYNNINRLTDDLKYINQYRLCVLLLLNAKDRKKIVKEKSTQLGALIAS